MPDKIIIFPYIATPNGINICFSRNGGPVEQRHFPAGTKKDEIMAVLAGNPPPPKPDPAAEEKARKEAEREKRAESSQVPETKTEDELKEQDTERDRSIHDLNYMRQKLKEANVKGYQMWKAETIHKKYDELVKAGVIKED